MCLIATHYMHLFVLASCNCLSFQINALTTGPTTATPGGVAAVEETAPIAPLGLEESTASIVGQF